MRILNIKQLWFHCVYVILNTSKVAAQSPSPATTCCMLHRLYATWPAQLIPSWLRAPPKEPDPSTPRQVIFAWFIFVSFDLSWFLSIIYLFSLSCAHLLIYLFILMFASPFCRDAAAAAALPVVLVICAKRCQVTYFAAPPQAVPMPPSLSHCHCLSASFEGKLSNARTWYLSLALVPLSLCLPCLSFYALVNSF